MATPQEVLSLIKEKGIKLIDLKFIDLPGIWQHLTVYENQIDESSFVDGVAFDGSSIRGWKAINESDMSMVLDPDTAWIDPFMKEPTMSFICSIKEPRTGAVLRAAVSKCWWKLCQSSISFLPLWRSSTQLVSKLASRRHW
ncbi:glutamine synthetase beta-grasp domain-containing protein [Leptolyngbya sp. 7M]|uniref:glutamine synthetase beta-grasp domain-containing protein n=1 Tax=Leptolyngbya sp. 7M TaxID=2812896 RepID=UPI002938DB29|nr:glutamine synthetase beta-grasp domain-containing protein [Leptolyngbya sp. 7M]